MGQLKQVLDFLTENGFERAASALIDDVVARGGVVGHEMAGDPVLPPVRIGGCRKGEMGGWGADCGNSDSGTDSSSSSDVFVSIGCSPAEDITERDNPFANWNSNSRQAEKDDSSSSISEFGTARDYAFSNIFSDTNWYDQKFGSCSNDPYLMQTSSSGCSSDGKSLMTTKAEGQFGKEKNSDFLSETTICFVGRPEFELGVGCEDCNNMYRSSVPCCGSHAQMNVCQNNEFSKPVGDLDFSIYRNSILLPGKVEKFPEAIYGESDLINRENSLPLEKELHILASYPVFKDEDPEFGFWEGDLSSCSLRKSKPPKEEKIIESEKDLHIVTSSSVNDNSHANNGVKLDNKECNSLNHLNKESQSDLNNATGLDEYGQVISDDQVHESVENGKEDCISSNGLPMQEADEDEYEIFELRIVHRKNRTGFEENKEFPIVLNSVIAGRYYVTEYLGSAAFSKVVQAHDLQTGIDVSLKIIKNDKDFFDQSLDEIKLLKYVNKHDPSDEYHILRLYDYFYHQEHLFIVCELLKANLYEFQKYNQESGGEVYFTFSRIQSIAQQCLKGLEYLHTMGIIHCDLKPENILIKSYSRCEVKIIDLGSSCFQTDKMSLYVQSRSYRAPEVILGLPYDQKIDVWSLGCILAELFSGEVLFPNDSVATLLALMIGTLGPIDQEMLNMGQETHKYFTDSYDIYQKNEETDQVEYILPQKSSLAHRLEFPDAVFTDFLMCLLQTNPERRPTATEALQHPWLFYPYQ